MLTFDLKVRLVCKLEELAHKPTGRNISEISIGEKKGCWLQAAGRDWQMFIRWVCWEVGSRLCPVEDLCEDHSGKGREMTQW